MKKNYFIFLIIAIAVLIPILYFIFRGDKAITNYPPQSGVVVAFGDSLVEGVGATTGNDFVSLVERNLDIEIVNMGLSGDTTRAALSRLDSVLNLQSGVVMLLLGGNDVIRRIPREETFANLEKIIRAFQAEGSVVILMGVRGGILFDGYEDDYRDLAKKTGSAYVSNVLEGLITKKEYMSDGIHPNNAGYKIIADRVAPVLRKLLK